MKTFGQMVCSCLIGFLVGLDVLQLSGSLIATCLVGFLFGALFDELAWP